LDKTSEIKKLLDKAQKIFSAEQMSATPETE